MFKQVIITISILFLISKTIYSQINNNPPTYNFAVSEISQFKYYVPNNGQIQDIRVVFSTAGFWPGGRNAFKPLLYFQTMCWGGYINNEFNIYRHGLNTQLIPGKLYDDGSYDNHQLEKYRVYRILKNWETMPFGRERDQIEKDYNEWPVEDGAPWIDVDGDGIFTRGIDQPDYIGDEVLWYVAHDGGPTNIYPIFPDFNNEFKIEVQTTVFAFNRTGVMGDVVFRKYKYINKSQFPVNDMYLLYKTGMRYGDYDDHKNRGIDTLLNLVFAYTENPQVKYYDIPPAAGEVLIQGPIVTSSSNDSAKVGNQWRRGFRNLSISSFSIDVSYDTSYLRIETIPLKQQYYKRMLGLHPDGTEVINPLINKPTRFYFPGDPETNSGWTESKGLQELVDFASTSKRSGNYYWSVGPFTLAPFDTQEVVIATIAAQGTDHLNSVTELKRRAAIIKKAYEADFNLTPAPPVPKLTALPMQNKITLWWDDKAEEYDKPDPFILEQGYSDTTYTFEGYRIWQYRDKEGREPKQVAIFDVKNNISVIEDYIIANGISVKAPVIMGNDEGIQRYMTIEDDIYTGERLRNGTPYYFGVTSYAYSKESSPTFLESEHSPIEVIPGREKIDYSSPYKQWDVVLAEQVEGGSEADVIFKVVDPSSLTGDGYEVLFRGPYDTLEYSVINLTSGDTLYKWEKDFTLDTLSKRVTEGFMVLVNNIDGKAIMSLRPEDRPYGVKRVYEVIGTDTLGEVYQQKNSSGEWQLESRGTPAAGKQNYDIYNSIGYEDYEIRFTEGGSEYYTTGYGSNALFRNDPKGKGRVPFEVWNRTTGKRLKVKVWDRDLRDTMWTRDENSRRWEAIYAYESEEGYSEPLPELSGITKAADYRLGNIEIEGEIPKTGTSIYIDTYRPLIGGDRYRVSMERANLTDKESGRERIGEITVFPNPYMGYSSLERGREERFMRFTGMPTEATVRIYTLAGVFVRRIEKNEYVQWLDWDMRNEEGRLVSSGIYIAHIEMPGIGEKILKLAVVMEQQYLDRR